MAEDMWKQITFLQYFSLITKWQPCMNEWYHHELIQTMLLVHRYGLFVHCDTNNAPCSSLWFVCPLWYKQCFLFIAMVCLSIVIQTMFLVHHYGLFVHCDTNNVSCSSLWFVCPLWYKLLIHHYGLFVHCDAIFVHCDTNNVPYSSLWFVCPLWCHICPLWYKQCSLFIAMVCLSDGYYRHQVGNITVDTYVPSMIKNHWILTV